MLLCTAPYDQICVCGLLVDNTFPFLCYYPFDLCRYIKPKSPFIYFFKQEQLILVKIDLGEEVQNLLILIPELNFELQLLLTILG